MQKEYPSSIAQSSKEKDLMENGKTTEKPSKLKIPIIDNSPNFNAYKDDFKVLNINNNQERFSNCYSQKNCFGFAPIIYQDQMKTPRSTYTKIVYGEQYNNTQMMSGLSNIGNVKNNFNAYPNQSPINNIKNEKEGLFKGNNMDNKMIINAPFQNNYYNYVQNNCFMNCNEFNGNKNANLNLKMNLPTTQNINNSIHSSGTKFFTNHNYGYKCSCSKTQCNRKYCECYSSGNYCIDCNCKNCNNKPPVNTYTNKHPTSDGLSKEKKDNIICTCTKSGCNKNYCECFKNGQKCTSLCRCISCENNDEIINKKNENGNYECCSENSIYIIKNMIYVNTKDVPKISINIRNYTEFSTLEENFGIAKKRKRDEYGKKFEKKRKISNSNENDEFNDSLFDSNGKMILKHINLINLN